jgi:hypothetical protein
MGLEVRVDPLRVPSTKYKEPRNRETLKFGSGMRLEKSPVLSNGGIPNKKSAKPKSVRVGRFFGFEEMRIATKGLSKFDS